MTLKNYEKNGIIAFILPKGATTNLSMIPIWDALFKENFGIRYLIEASDIDEAFSDAQDQEIIAILQKNYGEKARFVKLFGALENQTIDSLIKEIDSCLKPREKTKNCLIQVLDQMEVQRKKCTEWRLYPSSLLIILYSKYIPLAFNELTTEERKKYQLDLSDCISVVTENASRPADYWFIPNKFWEIKEIKNEKMILIATSANTIISEDSDANQEIVLPMDAIVPTMARSLKEYASFPPIIPPDSVENYYLLDEKRKDVALYYEWGKKAHENELFGKAHSRYTPNLNDGGIIAKIDYFNSKTIALRFRKPLVGTRLIRFGFKGENSKYADLFFAYLNSSLFLLDVFEKSRTRRAEFVKINRKDFLMIFRFPNLKQIEKDMSLVDKILKNSSNFNGDQTFATREKIPEKINSARINPDHPLRKLDEAWFEALDMPIELLDSLYEEIEIRLKDIIEKKR